MSRAPVVLPAAWVAGLTPPRLVQCERADSRLDGASRLVFKTDQGARIETVVLRIASGRNALCLSIQSRCPAACTFCASGTLGKPASLTLEELLEQVVRGRQLLRDEGRRLRNLVFMGMGEPLLEPELLQASLRRLLDPGGFAFAQKNVVVSTVGLPAQMVQLAREFPGVRQALSLHTARQEQREKLIPMARRHDLAELRAAVGEVARLTGGRVFVEVLLLEGVTDRPEDLAALEAWLLGLPVLLNLIPFNIPAGAVSRPSLDSSLRPTSRPRCAEIAAELRSRGLRVTLRHSLGSDIAAACGQLAARGS
jgi:23S rRNA (adenine2503-C2)-methyltransferase